MKLIRNMIVKHWDQNAIQDRNRKASQTPVSGITKHVDIPYLPDSLRVHFLDIYYPENTRSPLPVIVDIHGGGWMYGNKELNEYYCLYLASLGFAVVNINYRLAPAVHISEQISDIFAALRWLQQNGQDYCCDTENYFICGDSAGGHLSALTAAIQASEPLQKVYQVKPCGTAAKAVGISCGVFDLSMLYNTFHPLKREMGMIILGDKPRRSPYYSRINLKDIIAGLKLPPFHLVSCEADSLHPQSVAFDALLTQNNVDHAVSFWSLTDGPDLTHVFNILYPQRKESVAASNAMADLFRKQL